MTTTSTQPDSDKKHHHHDRKQQHGKDRRPQQPIRRSAAEIAAQPPRGYTVKVHELEKDTGARKRIRLLVLESENGWKVLPFMSIRIEKNARTVGANIAVLDDLDILPANYIEAALEVNLVSDDALLNLATLVEEYREKQKHVLPAHKRPFVQRPFEDKLPRMLGQLSVETMAEEEEDMAKKKTTEVKTSAKPAPAPAQPRTKKASISDAWWYAASVC